MGRPRAFDAGTGKFSSFQRQLNNFGFRRAPALSTPRLRVYIREDLEGYPSESILALRRGQKRGVAPSAARPAGAEWDEQDSPDEPSDDGNEPYVEDEDSDYGSGIENDDVRPPGGERRGAFEMHSPKRACSCEHPVEIGRDSSPTEYPRRGRGVAATRLNGISTSRPRRRRDSSQRNIHVAAAASP